MKTRDIMSYIKTGLLIFTFVNLAMINDGAISAMNIAAAVCWTLILIIEIATKNYSE